MQFQYNKQSHWRTISITRVYASSVDPSMQSQLYLDICVHVWVFGTSLPVCSVGRLSIEHSSDGPLWAGHARTPTLAHSHTSKHIQTYSLFPTGARCLCCVINQSCQIDFTAPSEKEERQPPNNLEKMEESKSIGVLLLLKLIPGPKESIKNEGAVSQRTQYTWDKLASSAQFLVYNKSIWWDILEIVLRLNATRDQCWQLGIRQKE